jgi:hypothetical protein
MNETIILSGDSMLIAVSIAFSVVLGGLHRLSRTVSSERREVDRARIEMRDLEERCDLQQVHMARLGQQLNELRLGASRAAPSSPVAAPVAAPVPEPAADERVHGPAVSTPAVARAAVRAVRGTAARVRAAPAVGTAAPGRARKRKAPSGAAKAAAPNPFELARAGADVDAVMKRCGLSRPEAELVVSVHGRSAA